MDTFDRGARSERAETRGKRRPVKKFRRSLENTRRVFENTGEQTRAAKTGGQKTGCRALVSRNPERKCAGQSARHEPQTTHPMTTEKLQKLVDDAVALHREVATKTEALKALKAELVREAEEHPEAHVPTERGGKRWTARGTDGCIARVSFPAATLAAEIQGKGEQAQQCHEIAGEHFRHLFTTVKSYQLVDDFRAHAASLLPAHKAGALIAVLESESAPRVNFETAKRAKAVNAH